MKIMLEERIMKYCVGGIQITANNRGLLLWLTESRGEMERKDLSLRLIV
jgi:hypothetical protein